jgi:hypothetical protein
MAISQSSCGKGFADTGSDRIKQLKEKSDKMRQLNINGDIKIPHLLFS